MLENDLFTALGGLVSGRCYPSEFRQANGGVPTWPAIRYTFIAITPVEDICGDGGDAADETADVRVQIDVVAEQYSSMRTLRIAVMGAMAAFTPPARCELMAEQFDAETKTHRGILDYRIQPSSATP